MNNDPFYSALAPDERDDYDEYAGKLIDSGEAPAAAEAAAMDRARGKRADREIGRREKIINIEAARDIANFRIRAEYRDVFDQCRDRIKRGMAETHINSFAPTEMGQAEAADLYFDGIMRHTPGAGWMVYDDSAGAFRADIGGSALRLCLQDMGNERYNCRESDEPKEYARYAEKAVTLYNIRQVEGLLKDRLAALDSDFDQNIFYINCRGWTYDLRSGERAPSLPEHAHSKSTGFTPLDGDCPEFKKFLDEVTLGDTQLAAWIMRWFGYNLTGDTRAPFFVNLHGSGRNGKGVLLCLMRKIMGSYAAEIDSDVVVDTGKGGNKKNALANLPGVRAGFASEVPAGALNLSDLKKLTGGGEIVGERKYHDAFAFRPMVKLTFASNPMLRLADTGQAVKSRLRYIPFRLSVAGREDAGLEDRLLKEGPQILAWLIREAGEYLKNPGPKGFPLCDIIDSATKEYVAGEDIIGQFLEERVEPMPGGRLGAKMLYDCFRGWSERRGDKKVASPQAFGRKMTEKGMRREHNMYGWWYADIHLRADNGDKNFTFRA